jgi:2-C-methyl-D-erythritol 4-phosphate cytidylyltransferase
MVHLLIPAAGSGKRMGSERNKLLLKVCDRTILAWNLIAADRAEHITWIGLIHQPIDTEDFQAILTELRSEQNLSKPVVLILGGSTRQESVHNGLLALPTEAQHVLIHDGARCLATPDLFNRCADTVQVCAGFIAAIPVKDTIKQVDAELLIEATPDRSLLWAAQTPQGFDVALLKDCHAKGKAQGWEVTDDAALFEKCGLPVKIVMGEETNLKVTTPVDLALAEFILKSR